MDHINGTRYIKQGVICSDGDLHGDAKVIRNPSLKPILASELELVIRPDDYKYIEVTLVDENFEISLTGNFTNHEDPLH